MKFPFLLTSLTRSTLRSILPVKCHPKVLFFSIQMYSKDFAFQLLEFSIHKPISSLLKLFLLTIHYEKGFYQRRSITSFKNQPSQGELFFISTNETLSKDSVTEAIPLPSSIKSWLKFISPTEQRLFVTKQRGRKKFYCLLPLITRPHRILKRFS